MAEAAPASFGFRDPLNHGMEDTECMLQLTYLDETAFYQAGPGVLSLSGHFEDTLIRCVSLMAEPKRSRDWSGERGRVGSA